MNVPIPAGLFQIKPHGAFKLWIRLRGYAAMGDGGIFPSQMRLANELGTDKKNIRTWTAKLVEDGWLKTTKFRFKKSPRVRYTLGDFHGGKNAPVKECSNGVFHGGKNAPVKPVSGGQKAPSSRGLFAPLIRGREEEDKPGAAIAATAAGGGRRVRRRPTRAEVRESANRTVTGRSVWKDPYVVLSRQLAEAVRAKLGINTDPRTSLKHAKALRYLTTKKRIELPRLQSVMQWWCDALVAGKWTGPFIDCTSRFRTMFGAVEDAMRASSNIVSRFPAPSDARVQAQMTRARILHHDIHPRPASVFANDLARMLATINEWCLRLVAAAPKSVREEWGLQIGSLWAEYALWIPEYLERWRGWGGRLDGFYPGGKHFSVFLRNYAREFGWTADLKQAVKDAGCEDVVWMDSSNGRYS